MDRFNHDMNVSGGGGDDTDDTDDLPVFGSFGSYSPQYKKHNSSVTSIEPTMDDIFLANEMPNVPSSINSSIDSKNTSKPIETGAIPRIKTLQLRKLDVSAQWLECIEYVTAFCMFINTFFSVYHL